MPISTFLVLWLAGGSESSWFWFRLSNTDSRRCIGFYLPSDGSSIDRSCSVPACTARHHHSCQSKASLMSDSQNLPPRSHTGEPHRRYWETIGGCLQVCSSDEAATARRITIHILPLWVLVRSSGLRALVSPLLQPRLAGGLALNIK